MKLWKLSLASLAMLTVCNWAMAQGKPASLMVATASPGGVYAVYGEGLAGLLSETMQIPTSTRQTQGPSQNLALVETGKVELGMTTTGPALDAIQGHSDLSPGVKHQNVRALFSMYPTPFQMVALKSANIASVPDLAGKRIGVGPKAGTGGVYWPRWFKALGISASFQFGGAGDQGDQLADGRLDALLLAGGAPHPTIKELESTKDVAFFGFDDGRLNTIRKSFPDVVPFEIPAGTYKSQTGTVLTGAMWNIVIVNKAMSDELAYGIVKAVFAHQSRLLKTHAAAKDTLPENILKNTAVPLHPGAIRFYKEQGIQLPAAILPPG